MDARTIEKRHVVAPELKQKSIDKSIFQFVGKSYVMPDSDEGILGGVGEQKEVDADRETLKRISVFFYYLAIFGK